MLYDELIMEEEENVLTGILREAAKEKLNQEIRAKITHENERWEKCFDVAEEVIKDATKRPTLPEQKVRATEYRQITR